MGICVAGEKFERPRAPRYSVSIPAIMIDGTLLVTGVIQNISNSGALLTNASDRPEVSSQGRLRLTNLRMSLRTTGPDSIELPATVARHDPAGFAVQFTGASEDVHTLIERTLSQGTPRASGRK